ncbi:hypothetical protein AGR2A_Lc150085 [Agrobacterium genomosp. 2 str. CFBP 5494]|uniref:Uncharacterized protein n=1 Tax=Agrobacterium genomosp. 2 str. CFBP 5494 TaxID=1183436 RepID=A0A9W5B3K1_9HYPH|nr:hypothetical protein AGR2A_Lc150085 [Agrobacterium genomosp. 2 str. CFBP 5494]
MKRVAETGGRASQNAESDDPAPPCGRRQATRFTPAWNISQENDHGNIARRNTGIGKRPRGLVHGHGPHRSALQPLRCRAGAGRSGYL